MIKKLSLLTILSITLFTTTAYSAGGGCCCTDCICPSGPQGSQGIQGVQGIQGAPGTIGTQGPIGPEGPCCSTNRNTVVADLYSLIDQHLDPGSSVLFENSNAVTLASFDTSLAPSTGGITFLTSGTYSIAWRVDGQLTPPYPDPVPVWSLALFLDGMPVLGSCFAGFSLFPALLTSNGASNIIIVVNAGQVLTLRNTSLLPISILSSVPGSSIPQISATISVIKE